MSSSIFVVTVADISTHDVDSTNQAISVIIVIFATLDTILIPAEKSAKYNTAYLEFLHITTDIKGELAKEKKYRKEPFEFVVELEKRKKVIMENNYMLQLLPQIEAEADNILAKVKL